MPARDLDPCPRPVTTQKEEVHFLGLKPLLISQKEAAYLLGLSPRTVHNLVASGELPVRRIGRRVLIHYKDLEVFAKRDHAIGGGA